MSDEIDFFRGINAGLGEERTTAINQRYMELLQIEGDKILAQVATARLQKDEAQVNNIQKKAKSRVMLQVALEFNLIGARPDDTSEEFSNLNFIPPFGVYDNE